LKGFFIMAFISVLLIFILCAVFCIAVPAMIGIYVYRDSKHREMNQVLWVLLSVFAPGYIGFIIYLLVRNQYANLNCPVCGKGVREGFSVCPYCGAPLKITCTKCGYPLEGGWERCPCCGETIPQEQKFACEAQTPKSDKSLKRILIAAIVIPLVLCIGTVSVGYAWRTNTSAFVEEDGEISKSVVTSEEAKKWLESCDAQGSGVYAFRALNDSEIGKQTEYLVYIKIPYSHIHLDYESSLFKDANFYIRIQELSETDEAALQYALYHFTVNKKNVAKLCIRNDASNSEIPFKLTEAKDTQAGEIISGRHVTVDIAVDDELRRAYDVGYTLWSGENAIESEGMSRADNESVAGEIFTFDTGYLESSNITAFSIELLDKDGNAIFESEKYSVDESDYYMFKIGSDEKGKIVILS